MGPNLPGKDYIMRMIEEFGRVMARIALLKETENYTDAITELDDLSKLVTGFGMEHLMSLGADGIQYVFSQNKETEAEKIYCAARIIKEEGLILQAEGKIEESLKSFLITKELFRKASEMDFDEKVDALKEFEELNKI